MGGGGGGGGGWSAIILWQLINYQCLEHSQSGHGKLHVEISMFRAHLSLISMALQPCVTSAPITKHAAVFNEPCLHAVPTSITFFICT